MVSLFEKITYVLSALILGLVAIIYICFGVFETQSAETIQLELVSSTPPTPTSIADAESPAASSPQQRRKRQILAKLKEQVRLPQNMDVKLETRKVPKKVLDYISKPGNWMPELEKAASNPVKNKRGESTMLEIFGFDEGSLLKEFGFQEGDQVSLIDGDFPPPFDSETKYEYAQLARRLLTKLERGQTISVTLMRKGRPVHLQFNGPK